MEIDKKVLNMLKPKTYQILKDCIERGLQNGLNKTIKYSEDISNINQDLLLNNQNVAIMNEICEYFDFDEE
jgi:hypothetical protein